GGVLRALVRPLPAPGPVLEETARETEGHRQGGRRELREGAGPVPAARRAGVPHAPAGGRRPGLARRRRGGPLGQGPAPARRRAPALARGQPPPRRARRTPSCPRPAGGATGACALLFTDKFETPAAFKALSYQFRGGALPLGEARGANLQLSNRFGVGEYPTLIAFCDGDEKVQIPYDGNDYKAENVQKFLKSLEDGSRCKSARKSKKPEVTYDLHNLGDLTKMKMKELRKILDQIGQGCDGCIEKLDFIKQIEASIASAAA
ncbi:unnamed protein product, partial [Heterosigma akashiwo]